MTVTSMLQENNILHNTKAAISNNLFHFRLSERNSITINSHFKYKLSVKQSIRLHDIHPGALFVQELDSNHQVQRIIRPINRILSLDI